MDEKTTLRHNKGVKIKTTDQEPQGRAAVGRFGGGRRFSLRPQSLCTHAVALSLYFKTLRH